MILEKEDPLGDDEGSRCFQDIRGGELEFAHWMILNGHSDALQNRCVFRSPVIEITIVMNIRTVGLLHESPQLLSTYFPPFASHNGRSHMLTIEKQQDIHEKSKEFSVKGSTLG